MISQRILTLLQSISCQYYVWSCLFVPDIYFDSSQILTFIIAIKPLLFFVLVLPSLPLLVPYHDIQKSF